MTYEARIERDGNDLILILPKEVMDHLGVKAGDEITWAVGSDGTVVITPTLSTGDVITFDIKDIKE